MFFLLRFETSVQAREGKQNSKNTMFLVVKRFICHKNVNHAGKKKKGGGSMVPGFLTDFVTDLQEREREKKNRLHAGEE